MQTPNRRTAWMGVIGALGVAVIVLAVVGGLVPVMPAIGIAVAIWMVGATLVNALLR